MLHFFFGFSGRIRRRGYLFGLISASLMPILVAAAVFVIGRVEPMMLDPNEPGHEVFSPTVRLVVAITNFFSCWMVIALYSKRVNDFGEKYEHWFGKLKPLMFLLVGMYYLLLVLSIIALGETPNNTTMLSGIVLGLILVPLFITPQRGPNRHGSDPRDPDALPYEAALPQQALSAPPNAARMKEMARSGSPSGFGAQPLPGKIAFGKR